MPAWEQLGTNDSNDKVAINNINRIGRVITDFKNDSKWPNQGTGDWF